MSAGLQYLLDTDVLPETRRRQAEARVISFLSAAESSALYISVLTLGELRRGVALKERSDPDSARKIAARVDGLEFSFADRILAIDRATAKLWGQWSAQRPRPVIDTVLAATAAVHELTFVTRNIRDVEDVHVKVLNPWDTGKKRVR